MTTNLLRTRPRVLAVLAVSALAVLAACSSTTPTATPGSGSSGSPKPGAGTAPPAAPPDQPDRVMSLPGLGAVDAAQFAGYASVKDQACASITCDGTDETGLYYWFVSKDGSNASKNTSPTILWTNGGPGATSFWGLFTENGPYAVNKDLTLAKRPHAWNETANYLIFDHPLGVGLSFASDAQLPTDVQAGVAQWYTALVHFLERHPDVAANPIVLAGESYGGTYVPLLAKAILDGNTKAGRQVVHLGGIILAAPWTDPVVGQSMDTTYAFTHGLISAAEKERLDKVYDECRAAIEAHQPSTKEANDTCSKIKSGIEAASGRYLLNIASLGDPPTDQVVTYLNQPDVRAAIHAKTAGTFAMFSEPVGDRYAVGAQDSYRWAVQEVLDQGVKVLDVQGLNDATDVNPLGNDAWLDLLAGPHAAAYQAAETTQWKDADGKTVLGYLREGGGLTVVKVLNAGHLAAVDQPKLIDLIQQKLLAAS